MLIGAYFDRREEEDAAALLEELQELVETLMGKKAELRFKFIQDNASFVSDIDV